MNSSVASTKCCKLPGFSTEKVARTATKKANKIRTTKISMATGLVIGASAYLGCKPTMCSSARAIPPKYLFKNAVNTSCSGIFPVHHLEDFKNKNLKASERLGQFCRSPQLHKCPHPSQPESAE